MHAIEQGKEVLAFPGNIFSYKSIGNHYLIKNGAYLIENSKDLLEILFPDKLKKVNKFLNKREIKLDTENEKLIYEILKNEPKSIDSLIMETGLDYGEIFSTISHSFHSILNGIFCLFVLGMASITPTHIFESPLANCRSVSTVFLLVSVPFQSAVS